MSSILPNDEALRALVSNPDEGKVVMLNLLKFKGEEGARAYDRYVENVSKILEARGARIIYSGKAAELLVGDDTWDAIILVEYPSRKVFVEMVNNPEYLKVQVDREQGLERTVLYATSPMGEGERFFSNKIN
ncbi:DUF1330 domain-containing protein [Methanosarcina sp. Kolksee]|uniref:DUF1330 domain-containing protein n=1 Tax=Methanosarcina sp. Kolksee TaxID=1434099 RepID=UPI00064E86A6|nr:DUF1330 domain-containing protein [Methanosarcina sp. Kolksee]